MKQQWQRRLGISRLKSSTRRRSRARYSLHGRVSRWKLVLKRRSVRLAAGGVAAVFVATLFFTLYQQKEASAAIWWSPDWNYRKQITFNNSASSENLVDFPVRVALSSSNIDYSKTMDNGNDLRFTDSDGTTQLRYEIENWNEAGTSNVWVKVPQIDTGSTTDSIWMYYGNRGAAKGQSAASVWDGNYRGVWHTKESSGGDMADSTANANTGSRINGAAVTTSGKIGNAESLDGSNDYIGAMSGDSLDNLRSQGNGGMTISAWIYADNPSAAAANTIAVKASNVTPTGGWTFVHTPGNVSDYAALSHTNTTGSILRRQTSVGSVTRGQWHHVAATFNGGLTASTSMVVYINGQAAGSYSSSTTITGTLSDDSGETFELGGDGTTVSNYFDGILDETRVSNKVRSADWIEAEYITGNDAMNSFGSEQSGSYSPDGVWTKRRKITMNNSASSTSLVGFPLRVSLSAANNNIDYGSTQNQGQDIRFTDSSGTDLLSHEIDTWNESGTSEVWVKIPVLDGASTTDYIWMYYGNSSAADWQHSEGVWINNNSTYAAVYHMDEENAAGNHQDSTIGDADLTTTNLAGQGTAAGKIGDADEFELDTGSDNVSRAHHPSLGLGSVTLEAWINMETAPPAGTTLPRTIVSKVGASPNLNYQLQVLDTNEIKLSYFNSGGTELSLTTTTSPLANTGQFYKVTGVIRFLNINLYSLTIYVNGSEVDSTNQSSGPSSGTGGFMYVGLNANDNLFDGVIDEVRIYDGSLLADWIEATYISENLNMNTFGSEETGTYLGGGTWTYRRKVSFNNVPSGSNLTNFPVRVSLGDVNAVGGKKNIDYTHTKDHGEDIRFIASDDVTTLPHEIETWNESGTSEVWVNVPSISAGSQTGYIWMYYGANVSDGQQLASTWNSNLTGVWHLNGSSGHIIEDSLSDDEARKFAVGEPANTSGQISGAQLFDGTNDYVFSDNFRNFMNSATQATVEAWVSVGDTAAVRPIVNVTGSSNASNRAYLTVNASEQPSCTGRADDAESNQTVTASSAITTGVMHQLVCVIDFAADTIKIYVDGQQVTATGTVAFTATATDPDSSYWTSIGAYPGGSLYSPATIDEVRVANTGYSADLIKAGYRNTTDTLATYGGEETSSSTGDAWCSDSTGVTCDSNWNYRRRVEFINAASAENLGNNTVSGGFPVLVKLSTALGNIDYSKTQDDGDDIRFVDPSNTSLALNHEIETWNEAGDSYVWVGVPQIDTGKNSDYIYMYYGNATVSSPATQLGDDTHATGVWDANNAVVYHMDETSGAHQDSTANNLDTTTTSPAAQGTAVGMINGADDFEASTTTDLVQRSSNSAFNLGTNFTVEAWVKPESAATTTMRILTKNSNYELGLTNTDEVRLYYNTAQLQTVSIETTTSPITPGNFYKITGVRDNVTDALSIYINGAFVTSVTNATVALSTNNPVYIGRNTTSEWFDGIIDEVRISSTNRSADWIEATFNSEHNAMATYGLEEYSPPAAPTLTALTGQQSTTPTFQLRSADVSSPNWLRYKIEVCTNADCSTILRTIDQASDQTGWTGQDANSNTAYVGSATLASSTLASHTWQTPALANGTTYWWRAYATDDLGGVSSVSSISSFQTLAAPATPTLVNPADTATGVPLTPDFRLWTTDLNGDNVKYLIDVCDTASCTDTDGGGPLVGVYRAIDQQISQTGWAAQNAESGTSYSAHTDTLASGSQQAVHVYQLPKLNPNTQYWWRAKAFDPTGSNMSSSYSSIWSFTTNPNNDSTRIQGGTKIMGGTTLR
jgi:hypothetical protein